MTTVEKPKISGYILTVIDSYGERFQKAFPVSDLEGLKKSLANIQTQNRYLSIEVSTVARIATFERGATNEPYLFTRQKGDDTIRSRIRDITKAFK